MLKLFKPLSAQLNKKNFLKILSCIICAGLYKPIILQLHNIPYTVIKQDFRQVKHHRIIISAKLKNQPLNELYVKHTCKLETQPLNYQMNDLWGKKNHTSAEFTCLSWHFFCTANKDTNKPLALCFFSGVSVS